jgi:hypothetical protein
MAGGNRARIPDPSIATGSAEGASRTPPGARMRRSAGKGTDGGQIGDGGASVPVISCAPMPSTEAMERRRREPNSSPVSKPARSSPLHRRIGPRTRHDSRPWPPASRSFRTDAAIR